MPATTSAVPARLLAMLDWIVPPQGRPAIMWRRRILGLVLVGFAVLAAVPYAAGVYRSVSVGERTVIVVDTAAYLLLLTVVFARRAPFAWRAGFLVTLPLLLGSFLLVRFGPSTSGFVWLMVGPIMASVLFAWRVSLGLLGMQTVVLAWVGSTLVSNTALWPIRQPGDIEAWLTSSTSYVAITMLLSYAMGVLFRGLAQETDARQAAEREADRQQQLAALGTVATAIAHDVNNLLQPLLSEIDVLRLGALDDQERAAVLDRMVAKIDQARGLMLRARRFARPGDAAARVPIDLARVVPEAVRAINATIPRFITLRLAPVPSCFVLADAAEIQRLLVLLVANAVEALPNGGTVNIALTVCDRGALVAAPPPGAYRVTFKAPDEPLSEGNGPLVMIQVHDDGSGMTPDAMNALRASVAASDDRGLEALGLGTVQQTIRDLGGTFRLCSRFGDGACAEVFLPQHDGPLSLVHTGEWRRPDPPLAAPANPILVVDDEPAVLQATSRLLERLGYRAVCTTDPLTVESMLPTIDPPVGVVLSDVHMPGLDGWQLAERLHAAHPELPLVMMSGHADALQSELTEKVGMVAFIAKPFSVRELGQTIGEALREGGRKVGSE